MSQLSDMGLKMSRVALFWCSITIAAIGCIEPFAWFDTSESIEAAPTIAPFEETPGNSLDSAADCLERGDKIGAIPHLKNYLEHYPHALMLRAQLAELYLQQAQNGDAEVEYQRFICDAQSNDGQAYRHMVHCRTRLMELAELEGNDQAMARHQGIGLWLLVQRWQSDPERYDPIMAEQTLDRALDSLRQAATLDPSDATVHVYLAFVLSDLKQPEAARNAWRSAQEQRPDPRLTAWERGVLRHELAKLEASGSHHSP